LVTHRVHNRLSALRGVSVTGRVSGTLFMPHGL
jgi:hypothetical protein